MLKPLFLLLVATTAAHDSGAADTHTFASQNALLRVNSLEHRSVLQDIRNDNESDESTSAE
jgi:hypothetical protein